MKTIVTTACYFTISIIFIIYRTMASPLIALILKALIIPVLMILLIMNIRTIWNNYHTMILLALVFSWFGDILLEVPVKYADLFIPGLISFLLAHVMYLTVFFTTKGDNFILKKRGYLFIPVALYGILLLCVLHSSLGQMKLPVTIYTVVILTMVCGAINRYGMVNFRSWLFVLIGAIFFLLSDSGIAINKFFHQFYRSQLLIMSTYVAAQYLIVMGYIWQDSKTFR